VVGGECIHPNWALLFSSRGACLSSSGMHVGLLHDKTGGLDSGIE
jgi:hypothetical protein